VGKLIQIVKDCIYFVGEVTVFFGKEIMVDSEPQYSILKMVNSGLAGGMVGHYKSDQMLGIGTRKP